MDRIAHVSRIFRLLSQIIFVVIPLLTAVTWITFPSSFKIKILGFIINMLTASILMLISYFFIKLFRNYEYKNIFSLNNVHIVRNIGYTLIIWQILIPIRQALLSLLLTWHNGPGKRVLVAHFDNNNITIILIAFIVILISWIMAEGYKLQQEQKYTV